MNIASKRKGFTVIELMIVVAILAVLLAVGVPSMSSLVRKNELKAGRSTVLASLAFARGESIARRQQVVMCSSSDGATCSNSTDWSNGWIAYRDVDEDTSLTTNDCNPTTECLLRVESALSGQATLLGNAAFLAYTSIGTRVMAGLSEFRLCGGDADASNDTDHSYTVAVSDAGLNRQTNGTNTCP